MGSEGWNIAESRGVRGGIYFSRVELELRSYKGDHGLATASAMTAPY